MSGDDFEESGKQFGTVPRPFDETGKQLGKGVKQLRGDDFTSLRQKAIANAVKCFEARRLRDRFFSEPAIFGEPGWDLLLDLYIRKSHGEVVSLRSASIRISSPANVAFRWLDILKAKGFIRYIEGSDKSERETLEMTPEGFDLMTRYFAQVET